MKIRKGKYEIHISNLVFVALPLVLLSGFFAEYLVAFVSIALHELGHAAAARARGRRPGSVGITPVGLSIALDDEDLSTADSLLIFSAGPAVNLLLAALSQAAGRLLRLPAGQRDFFFFTNICLAAFNLLPAIPLDGGRLLWKLLACRAGCMAAGRIVRAAAFAFSAAFVAAGLFQLAAGGMKFSLFIVGLYIMFLLFTGKMEAALMNIKQIIYRRSRLLKKGVYPARDLVALKSTPVGEILKNLDFDRFHFIYVLDERLKLIGMLNENEIMEGMVEADPGITFAELLEAMEKRLPMDK